MNIYGEKKSALTWFTQIFLGVAVLVFIGVIAFGIIVTRDDFQGFSNLRGKSSDNSFSLD